MKFLLASMLVVAWACSARADLFETQVNQSIPDGDLSGLASTIDLSGLNSPVTGLEVHLNITGTFDGDLYVYLTHGTGFSVLLNRTGRTANDDLGYSDGGFDVTFADKAPDVHSYRLSLLGSSSTPLGGPLSGTWSPDGRAVSPETVSDTDPRGAFLSSFEGLDPNGPWTLFVADVSGGDLHQLKDWTLELNAPSTAVPEVWSTAGLLIAGMASLWATKAGQRRSR